MPSLRLGEIQVDFPFTPYRCQEQYMSTALEAISSSSNATLESPTGTGKTLCLLCSTLAWQQEMKRRVGGGHETMPASIFSVQGFLKNPRNNMGVGKIIYASRTHSQLKQVVSELKSTSYHPKLTVLGSREQLCVHEKVSKMRGNALNYACSSKIAQRACNYKNNLESYTGNNAGGTAAPIQDIEDLVAVGKKDRICPYYFSRDSADNADLILLPYNYLMDGTIRASLKIDWSDAVVIFDEAHNLERVAADASSFSFSSTDIAACITELQHVLRKLQQEEEVKGEKDEKPLGPGSVERPNIHVVVGILKALFDVEKRLDDLPLTRSGIIRANSSIQQGPWLVNLFEAVGLSTSAASRNIDELRRCADLLLEEQSSVVAIGSSVPLSEPKLSTLAKLFAVVFRGKTLHDARAAAVEYRVYICEEEEKKGSKSSTSSPISSKKGRVLNYWCFSSGIAMQDLKALGVRSIIMTSGTLSPMSSFKEDMNIPIPISLENPHVIERNQVFVGAVSTGPRGRQLNSSYSVRDTPDYKDELGESILMICQTMANQCSNSHVPSGLNLEGGVLVFFPSYGIMESAVQRWKQTGLFERLREAGGGIIIEPRAGAGGGVEESCVSVSAAAGNKKSKEFWQPPVKRSGGFSTNSTQVATAAATGSQGEEKLLSGLVAKLDTILEAKGRCVMLAVCRGKISEGIDFRDSKGRVVIITGIPFAPHMDPWVVLKKQYLDERLQSKTKSGSSGGLSGQSWYMQSASRAVNQAVGRVIRHRRDWGAIFLLDDRFLSQKQTDQLSGWVRPNLRKFTKNQQPSGQQQANPFFSALTDFRRFASEAMSNPDLNAAQLQPERVLSRQIPSSFKVQYDEDADQLLYDGNVQEVVISADAIKDTDSSTYVDPSLLVPRPKTFGASLQRSGSGSGSCQEKESDPDADLKALIGRMKKEMTKPASQKSSSASSSTTQSTNLLTRLSHADRDEEKPKSLRESMVESAHRNQSSGFDEDFGFSKAARPRLTSSLSLSSAAHNARMIGRGSGSSGRGPVPLVQKKGLSKAGLSAAFNIKEEPAPWHADTGVADITSQEEAEIKEKPVHPFFSKPSTKGEIKFSVSQGRDESRGGTESFNINRFLNNDEDEMEQMKEHVADLKAKMDRTKFKGFKSVVTKASADGLHQISQIGDFVVNIIASLETLDDADLKTTLKTLTPLIPLKFRDVYTSSCRKSVQSRSAKRAQKKLPSFPLSSSSSTPVLAGLKRGLAGTDMRNGPVIKSQRQTTETNVETTEELEEEEEEETLESVMQSQMENNTSSKRALALLGMSQSEDCRRGMKNCSGTNNSILKSSSKPSRPFKALAKENRSITKRIDTITSMKLSSPKARDASSASSVKTKSCLICREQSKLPYAAQCGHICCFQCWQHWFKVKSSCPVCRADASLETILKITIQFASADK